MQTPLKQLLFEQSEACRHRRPSSHRRQKGSEPPQFRSVSSPSTRPLKHASVSLQTEKRHAPLAHSSFCVQGLPVGATQTCPAHCEEAQSSSPKQDWPTRQSVWQISPQSTSPSPALRTPSSHDGSWQVLDVQVEASAEDGRLAEPEPLDGVERGRSPTSASAKVASPASALTRGNPVVFVEPLERSGGRSLMGSVPDSSTKSTCASVAESSSANGENDSLVRVHPRSALTQSALRGNNTN